MELQDLQIALESRKNQTPKRDIGKFAQSFIIDPLIEIPAPPVILSFNDSTICTLGNFSLLMGKAKSRKTFLITALASASISGESNIIGLDGSLPEDRKVILFDTEQSDYHAQQTVKRICTQARNSHPDNFIAYGLRPLTPAERVEVIDYVIQTTERPGIVIIDGLRDLLSRGINDEEEATRIISKILKWTHEYQLHIMLVLHQNKNDQNARGHVGTEAVNKAETVLSVSKDSRNPDVSIVTPEYCRDLEFEPFGFQINVDGLPELSVMSEPNNKLEEIRDNFKHLLPGMRTMTYNELTKEYLELAAVTERTATRHISQAVKQNIIVKGANGNYKLKIQNEEIKEPF